MALTESSVDNETLRLYGSGMAPESDLMTSGEVAAFARVQPSTVYRWAEDGTLPTALKLPGGARRFRRSDVIAMLTPVEPEATSA